MRCLSLLVLAGLCLALPANGQTAAPAITAAETSVRLGFSPGLSIYDDAASARDDATGALFGLTGGVSDLLPGEGLGGRLPDLYAAVGYDFTAGFFDGRDEPYGPGATANGAGDAAFSNSAIVRLGAGAPLAGDREIIPYIAAGFQTWSRHPQGLGGYDAYYKSELVGGGLRLDIADGDALVLSASAEGFAVIGGTVSVPSENFSGDFGADAEERVSLDADYRLNRTWHAFAGLGLTHYEYSGLKAAAPGNFGPDSTTFQLNSVFGVAYGF